MMGAAYLGQGLERVFERIQRERMQGVPVLNEALRVEAVGFIPWQGHCLGVLITPWFMNLMLLPEEGDAWQGLSVGEKHIHRFPSGVYEFIVGNEEGIGRYQMCSLFSPVFEFADQQTAVETAEAVMLGLMDEENRDETSMREKEIERLWRDEPESDPDAESDKPDGEESAAPTLDERLQRPISRSDLLRGHFLREP